MTIRSQYLFLLLKDNAFVERGVPSGVNYLERFITWTALAAKLPNFPEGRKTLKMWQDVVFKGVKHKSLDKPEEVRDGLQDLVKEMEEHIELEKILEEERAKQKEEEERAAAEAAEAEAAKKAEEEKLNGEGGDNSISA